MQGYTSGCVPGRHIYTWVYLRVCTREAIHQDIPQGVYQGGYATLCVPQGVYQGGYATVGGEHSALLSSPVSLLG